MGCVVVWYGEKRACVDSKGKTRFPGSCFNGREGWKRQKNMQVGNYSGGPPRVIYMYVLLLLCIVLINKSREPWQS